MKDYVIGFDVGGTRLKSGAVSRSGKFLAEGIQPSGASIGPDGLVKVIIQEAKRLMKKAGGPPVGIGIGFPGVVKSDLGVVMLPGRLKDIENYPIVPKLQKALKLPVVAENDGRLSIIAEKYYGLAKNKKWALTLTLGTGVGSGVMLDGQILRDPHLQFGTQMSHIVMQSVGGRLCLTGARGTGEVLCSATALANAVRDGLQRGIISVLTDRYLEDPHSIDFESVIQGVSKKDRLCTDEFRRWTENLGWLIVSAVHVYAPEIVILSGGATNAAKLFLKPLREHVNRHVFRYPKGKPVQIEISKVRDHAGVLGAAAVAWEVFQPSSGWTTYSGKPGASAAAAAWHTQKS
jgi:glucokinase